MTTADWFRNTSIEMPIAPCILSRIGCKLKIPHDAEPCRQRHKFENNLARLKDWRQIATRYDRRLTCSSPPAPSQPPSCIGCEA